MLEGKWIIVNGAVDGNETCKRIDELVRDYLELVGKANAGRSKLYLDRNDGRYWEDTNPHSEWHKGGPPTLTWVSEEYVKTKYNV